MSLLNRLVLMRPTFRFFFGWRSWKKNLFPFIQERYRVYNVHRIQIMHVFVCPIFFSLVLLPIMSAQRIVIARVHIAFPIYTRVMYTRPTLARCILLRIFVKVLGKQSDICERKREMKKVYLADVSWNWHAIACRSASHMSMYDWCTYINTQPDTDLKIILFDWPSK